MHSLPFPAYTCCFLLQSLQSLDAEKIEALLSILCEAMPDPYDPIDRDERNRIQAEYELDDLQMAVAVRWAPIERSKRRTAQPVQTVVE